jgi:phosphoribosylaminoimidazole (AIR) synthetase
MRKVFNLGIGFAFILPEKKIDAACHILEKTGEQPLVIGEVAK